MENTKQSLYIISKLAFDDDNKPYSSLIGGFSTRKKALKVLKKHLDSGDEYHIRQITYDVGQLEEDSNG